jgi:prepilin-type N-terminal cleavage/methylation domain-containing protein
MRSRRGFTLIELAIVLAVAGILAVASFTLTRAARRNAGVQAAGVAVRMRVDQLQFIALAEQRDQLLVVLDVPGNDAAQCGKILDAGCARVFHLRADPALTWKLQDFDVASPGANAALVEEDRLGEGIKFYLAAAGTALPPPFDAFASTFKLFDSDLLATCAGNRKCVAWRFRADGRVLAEPPDPTSPPTGAKNGHALALASELTGQVGAARQIGVLVAAPSGIVRAFEVP